MSSTNEYYLTPAIVPAIAMQKPIAGSFAGINLILNMISSNC
jgi:hypothetical protein